MIILILIFIFLFHLVHSFYGEPMNHIFKNIYLGDHRAAQNENYLKMYDILSVVNCAAELDYNYKDIKYF